MKIEITLDENVFYYQNGAKYYLAHKMPPILEINGEAFLLVESILATEKPAKPTPEQRFAQLIEGLAVKEDRKKWPNSKFWFQGDIWIFEHNEKNGDFWCNYYKIWQVFEKEFSMEYNAIQSFIKGKVEQHFKLKDVTPEWLYSIAATRVEQHFKLKDVTPDKKD